MKNVHPFRFGVFSPSASTNAEWLALATKVEALGYSTLATSDHIAFGLLAPLQALMAAAQATTTLRLATHVLANDFRNPVMLAHEIATLDLLSGGRVELGLGAGWYRGDYSATGIPFDTPGTRVKRLREAVTLIKALFADEPVTFHGQFYHVEGLDFHPKPVQRPHPPIYIGGAGRQMLSLAGREANIVGLDSLTTPEGAKDYALATAEGRVQQVSWIRESAGERFKDIELHELYNRVVVTDDRRGAAEDVARWIADFPPSVIVNAATTVEEVLAAPYLLIGSVDQIVEQLQERRERFGTSYVTVAGQYVDDFSPVVARLAGT